MDVLSEVLRTVKLDGAFFFNGEFSAPWCFHSPASRIVAPYISRTSGHAIIFHLLIEGRGYAHLEDERRTVTLIPGDIVIFPHGEPHFLGNGPVAKSMDMEIELDRLTSQGLKISRAGGGGEITRFVCGYMVCDPQLSQVLLGGLPRVLKINIRNDDSGQWLENSIRFSVGSSDASRPGGEAVIAKLSEVLFVEALRRYIALLPPEETGWLAGVRDPEVGKALALLHRKPAHPWTIAALANDVGISRSVLAERFRRYLSETPIAYLTRWRLQLGAQMLKSTSASVAHIASEVGYESEPAFNRAFKREFGLPPARFRNHAKAAAPSKPGRRVPMKRRRSAKGAN
jgi:AraC-like DNA-binding protein